MKANELRIGNLVTLDEKQRKELWENQIHAQKDFFEVKTIYSDNDISIEVDDEIIDISENEVDGILLNEDWFLKCKSNSIFNNGFTYKKTSTGRFEIYAGMSLITVIEFVHELQNLNFALLGEDVVFENEM
jgi:hypothetical protein